VPSMNGFRALPFYYSFLGAQPHEHIEGLELSDELLLFTPSYQFFCQEDYGPTSNFPLTTFRCLRFCPKAPCQGIF